MTTKFQSKIVKGNNKGAGFIRLPLKIRLQFKLDDLYKIIIMTEAKQIELFGKVKDYNGNGFYIPASLTSENKLINTQQDIEIKRTGGFYTSIGKDGRVYIPSDIGKKLNLKKDQIIKINATLEKERFEKIIRVRTRNIGKNKVEYSVFLGPQNKDKRGIFNVSLINKKSTRISKGVFHLINEFNYEVLDQNKTIIFLGNHIPIIINNNIKIEKLSYFLGAYFADGTKKGNSWAISASTFDQARYFLECHKQIIKDNLINYDLTYTSHKKFTQKERSNLINIWKENNNINLNKIRIIKSPLKDSNNRNKYGSLRIREHKQLVLILYNKILSRLIQQIKKNKDKKLALEFICGVLEGDGSPNAKARGHIHIATNKKELIVLKEIFKIAELRCNGYIENGNKATIRVGAFEIIKNLEFLKDKLFKYYPKRRKRLIKRLSQTGTARYLTGKQNNTSGWVKSKLKKENILEHHYKLTKKGKKIKRLLLEMEKEMKTKCQKNYLEQME